MDLRTIRDKYSHGAYGTAEEFRADMKLMFSNCYEYNPSWAPVWFVPSFFTSKKLAEGDVKAVRERAGEGL